MLMPGGRIQAAPKRRMLSLREAMRASSARRAVRSVRGVEVEVGRGRCWAWGWVEKGRWGVGGGEVVAFVVLLGFVVALLGVLVEGWVVVGVYQSVWAWWVGEGLV